MKKINWILMGLLILSGFWRLVDYPSRWVLNQDQARDAIIGIYEIKNLTFPLIGAYSSSGPYNFGPWNYWIIAVFTKLSFGLIDGPWIWFTILSISTTAAYYFMGRRLWGKRGGLVAGLLAALAVGQVENAPDMLNTAIVGWSSGWTMYFLVKMIEEKKIKWGIPLGFLVGLSINFHFQSWGLMTMLGMAFLINYFEIKKKIAAGVTMGAGWLIAFLPLVVFDIQRKGVWIKSVFWYYTEGVKKFYVPVRWLTEIRDFWPRLFGSVITGTPIVGYFIVVVIGFLLIMVLLKKVKITKTWVVIIGSLIAQVILMRFYKGVRSREYLIVFHCYIIFLTAWAIVQVIKYQKWMGISLLGLLVVMATWGNINAIKQKSQAKEILELNKRIGPSKVELYQTRGAGMISLPIFYLRYHDNLVADGGRKLGICDASRGECPNFGKLLVSKNNYKIYEIEDLEEKIAAVGYEKLTAKLIYSWLWVNYGW